MKTEKVVNKHHCGLGQGSSDSLTSNFDSGDAQGHELGKSEI